MAQNPVVGSIRFTKYGTPCKAIKKVGDKNLLVEFQDEHKYRYVVRYDNFLKQRIRNPYDKSVQNIGYLGECKNINSKCYSIWFEMIRRCYIKNQRNKAYDDVWVCDEWLCYANFEKWYEENYYEIDNEPVCIDKDILVKNNKFYSPQTCIFVPKSINIFFVGTNNKRSDLPLGVSKMTKSNTYFCSVDGRNYYGFKTKQEAHIKYLQEKDNDFHIKLQNYKDKIPTNIYILLNSINLIERLKDGDYIE